MHPDNQDGTTTGQQWQGVRSSRLVEDILVEEFTLENDITFGE